MYSQIGQDDWVIEKLKGKRNGFYVDIGASDGITHSNTYLLQKDYYWSGILAEPRRSAYSKLLSRSSLFDDTCKIFYGAVVGTDKPCVVEFQEYNLPELSTVKGYEGVDHLRGARINPEVYEVPCKTLSQLLKDLKAPSEIDYLSLDTEGSELDILLALDNWNIKLITVEHNNTRNKGLINKLLVGKGYILDRSVEWDDWYVREDIWSS